MSRALVVMLLIPMLAFSPGIVQIAYSQESNQDLIADDDDDDDQDDDDDDQASDASDGAVDEPIVEPPLTEFSRGQIDGKRDSKGHPAWILAGFGGGLIGVGISACIPRNPPYEALENQSPQYRDSYVRSYRESSRLKNVGYSSIGFGLLLFLLIASVSTSN